MVRDALEAAMKRFRRFSLLLAALMLAGTASAASRRVTDADAPRSLPADGPVTISWSDPAEFTEIKRSLNRWEAERGNWVVDLAKYMRQRSQDSLLPGETLDIHITDIARAGNYEPWRGLWLNDVRMVRDIYPPRMSFTWRKLGPDGQVIDEGEQKLVDMAFQMGTQPLNSDPLRYEKRMVDRWVQRDLRDRNRDVSLR
jgi:hypothetical protein